MRFVSRTALLIALLGLLLSDAPAQTTPKQHTGVIAGRVTLGDKPMANVGVVLFAADSAPRRSVISKVATDYDGRYRLSNVPAGRYTVLAIALTHVGPNDGMYGEPGKTVTIAEGETVEKIDFTLVRGGVITGRVTDAEGVPVIGEQVQLNQRDKPGQSRWVGVNFNPHMFETDDRGIYRIYAVAPGRYTISIGESQEMGSVRIGFGGRGYYTRTFHPNVTEESKATVVEISEGTEATNVDITLGRKAKSFTASGRAVDENGKPVAGAQIGHGAVMKEGNRIGGFGWGSLTDTDGRFRLDGLVPGRYAAFVWFEGETENYSDTVVFEITEGDVSGLELKLRSGASIGGIAVIEGTSDRAVLARLSQLEVGVNVEAKGPTAPKFSRVKIAPDGSFRISGVHPGKARLYLATYPPPKGFALVRVERDESPQQEFEITPGAQLTGFRIVFEYGTGTIRGQVNVENGPLPQDARLGISIRRRSDTHGFRGAQVDSRGRFLLDGLSTGEYELTLQVYTALGGQRRFPPVKQNVLVTNEVESEVTFTVDLNAKQPEGGNNE